MNIIKYISSTLLVVFAGAMVFMTACEDSNGVHIEDPAGAPSISYIRVSDPEAADSLLVSAELGAGIVIVGKNLGGTREVWFNDLQAEVTPAFVTNKTIFVSVPSLAPTRVTDMISLVDSNSDTLKHPFLIAIPAPTLDRAINEWPQAEISENLIIEGNYFFEPISVTFTGGVTGELVSVSQTRVEFTVPEGAAEGPVTVTTNFGATESTFHMWDSRNVILDFDVTRGNGWRIGMVEDSDGPVDGAYNVFRATLTSGRDEGPGAPSESGTLFEFWGGPAGRTENFYPLYPGSYRDYVMKFEAKVNSWHGGYLNFCLASPTHDGSNQEIWSNDLNARAIWGPWDEEGAEFSTNGQWITVTIPMTDFRYFAGQPGDHVEYTDEQDFVEENAGSLSAWLIASPENAGGTDVEFYIDNIRFVQP